MQWTVGESPLGGVGGLTGGRGGLRPLPCLHVIMDLCNPPHHPRFALLIRT